MNYIFPFIIYPKNMIILTREEFKISKDKFIIKKRNKSIVSVKKLNFLYHIKYY